MIPQSGIAAPCPPAAHYLTVQCASIDARRSLYAMLAEAPIDASIVVGLGQGLVQSLGIRVPGLRTFDPFTGPNIAVPASQADAWFYLRGNDPGETLLAARNWIGNLPSGAHVTEDVAAFTYGSGRDLTGYEDGTENPKGLAANEAAFVGKGEWHGSSFVAAQRWVHDLAALQRLAQSGRDEIIGRRQDTNEELADAPETAHVKRTAQESYSPPAFMLRRSMPYGSTNEHGLYFVAFGADLDRYERMLRRMIGQEDGVVDALFRFSRPVSGGYYWCPPVDDGKLRLPTLPFG